MCGLTLSARRAPFVHSVVVIGSSLVEASNTSNTPAVSIHVVSSGSLWRGGLMLRSIHNVHSLTSMRYLGHVCTAAFTCCCLSRRAVLVACEVLLVVIYLLLAHTNTNCLFHNRAASACCQHTRSRKTCTQRSPWHHSSIVFIVATVQHCVCCRFQGVYTRHTSGA
jgi:hypothetical protein